MHDYAVPFVWHCTPTYERDKPCLITAEQIILPIAPSSPGPRQKTRGGRTGLRRPVQKQGEFANSLEHLRRFGTHWLEYRHTSSTPQNDGSFASPSCTRAILGLCCSRIQLALLPTGHRRGCCNCHRVMSCVHLKCPTQYRHSWRSLAQAKACRLRLTERPISITERHICLSQSTALKNSKIVLYASRPRLSSLKINGLKEQPDNLCMILNLPLVQTPHDAMLQH